MGEPRFKIVSRGGLAWLECARLARLPWLLHAFSTRRGGRSGAPGAGLNLCFAEAGRRAQVEENQRLFLQQIGARRFCLGDLRQVHSAEVYRVVQKVPGRIAYHSSRIPPPPRPSFRQPAGDALVTDQPGVLLSLRSADCMPVLMGMPGIALSPPFTRVGVARWNALWRKPSGKCAANSTLLRATYSWQSDLPSGFAVTKWGKR